MSLWLEEHKKCVSFLYIKEQVTPTDVKKQFAIDNLNMTLVSLFDLDKTLLILLTIQMYMWGSLKNVILVIIVGQYEKNVLESTESRTTWIRMTNNTKLNTDGGFKDRGS